MCSFWHARVPDPRNRLAHGDEIDAASWPVLRAAGWRGLDDHRRRGSDTALVTQCHAGRPGRRAP